MSNYLLKTVATHFAKKKIIFHGICGCSHYITFNITSGFNLDWLKIVTGSLNKMKQMPFNKYKYKTKALVSAEEVLQNNPL